MIALAQGLGILLLGLGLLGSIFALVSAVLARRPRPGLHLPTEAPAVTILKPLYGADASLAATLSTFFTQDYKGAIQLLFCVQDAGDPAIEIVRELIARHPSADAALVIDSQNHGANPKISNVMNAMAKAKHDIIVLSDADIRVRPGYLEDVVTALQRPGVGVVTSLYTGHAQGGLWAVISAMGVSYSFLPSVVLGMKLGLAKPCFGSTIALRRATLQAIGGFAAFRNFLADDYEIGRAVRAAGQSVAIAAEPVGHICAETSFSEVFRHELRWARTVAAIDRRGHIGSLITHPFPLSLVGGALFAFSGPSLALVVLALAARMALKARIDFSFGAASGPLWLVPLRDMISFAVFIGSFFGTSVEWRGKRYEVGRDGALADMKKGW